MRLKRRRVVAFALLVKMMSSRVWFQRERCPGIAQPAPYLRSASLYFFCKSVWGTGVLGSFFLDACLSFWLPSFSHDFIRVMELVEERADAVSMSAMVGTFMIVVAMRLSGRSGVGVCW